MRRLFKLIILFSALIFLQSCTKTESDFSTSDSEVGTNLPESISLNASMLNVVLGNSVAFTVKSSKSSSNITADSKIFVNGVPITGYSYTFTEVGTYAIHATKNTLTSNVATISVVATAANVSKRFVHRTLVEEYSGTWCGNCPRILYGVDLLKAQTPYAIVVAIHLFNGDPFISSDGNNLANNRGVGSVPAGYINRTISWVGPQYQNVRQVIDQIKSSSEAGIAMNTNVTANTINIGVKLGFDGQTGLGTKVTVYLVEDQLFATQSNYSSNLYGGKSSIPNFRYDGVLRAVVTALGGDEVPNNEKNYAIEVPKNISKLGNVSVVAFVTGANGAVLNAQQVKLGENKEFEKL